MNERQGWFKSSFSINGGACVEVRFADGTAQVRDSKNPDGPVLVFSRGEWDAFELGVFHGEFPFPDLLG
jgi:hypothetical protein